jgi:hypothetical protein
MHSGYGTQWDVYMDLMEPLLTKVPYMTVIGNHERDWPGTGDRFTADVRDSGVCLSMPYLHPCMWENVGLGRYLETTSGIGLELRSDSQLRWGM